MAPLAWIYQTGSFGEAHIKAAKVDHIGEADLCVYIVSSLGMAQGDEFWFVDRARESARTWVYFTGRGMAQVTICFVKSRGLAGWRTEHRLKGKFR